MTEVTFHFNAANKFEHLLRVIRKGHRLGARLVVVAPEARLHRIDQGLWVHFGQEFIAHARLTASPEVVSRSPIVLATPDQDLKAAPHHEVLVSATDELVTGFGAFERVIEVVSQEDADRDLARKRWAQYAERGYAIQRLDLAQQNAA